MLRLLLSLVGIAARTALGLLAIVLGIWFIGLGIIWVSQRTPGCQFFALGILTAVALCIAHQLGGFSLATAGLTWRRFNGRQDTRSHGVGNEPLKPDIGERAMLFLAENLLNAAGFKHNQTEDTWMAPVRLPPVVTAECDESDIMEAMLEVHSFVEAFGCTYNNFAIGDGFVSLVGMNQALVAAVA